MTTDEENQFGDGKAALHDLGCVERISYEGSDGGHDTELYDEYKVWPTNECDKQDIAEACEKHPVEGYTLSPSMTQPKHDFIRVTVRTTGNTDYLTRRSETFFD